MLFTKKELIDELLRFKREKGRVPKTYDMTLENGYPTIYYFKKCFGTWNKALKTAGLEINKKGRVIKLKMYSNEFLISELQRFYYKNDRVPTQLDIQGKFGYPSFMTYHNYFKTWNNALEIAGLEINQKRCKLDGTETCSYCGKRADEINGFTQWYYHNGERLCIKHGHSGEKGIPQYVIKFFEPETIIYKKVQSSKHNNRKPIKTCYRCEKKKKGCLHHIIPKYFDGRDDKDNLVYLCDECHDYVEIKTYELLTKNMIYDNNILRLYIISDFPEV